MAENRYALALMVIFAASPAIAQEMSAPDMSAPDMSAEDMSAEVRATAAVGLLDETAETDLNAQPLLDAAFIIKRTDVLESGLSLAWRGEVRLERDAPNRPAFAGVLGACPDADPGCTGAAGGVSPPLPAPISPATGLAAGPRALKEEAFLAVEAASLSISGPWGEGIVGLDTGAASRLDARPPRILEAVSATSPTLDPTGRIVTRARNDVTGSSLKATLLTQRWIGLRLGASFTPSANHRGADFDPRFKTEGASGARLENVWEGAASFDRRFRSADIRVRAAATVTTADHVSDDPSADDRYGAIGAGLELSRQEWDLGLRWLSSDNGRSSGSRYEAIEVGLAREAGPWRIGVEGGWSRDRLSGIEGSSALIGARRRFGKSFDLGAALTHAEADLRAVGGRLFETRGTGLVFEATVRN